MAAVTAIIPCYNHGRYLAEAVESVLAQTYPDVEIVVVNDGSTDDTAAVAASFGERILYMEHANRGLCASRNRAIEETDGQYVAFLDADDRWHPEKLARQVPLLEADEEVGLVHTDGWTLTGEAVGPPIAGGADQAALGGQLFERLLLGNPILAPSVVVRRRCLEGVGLFDEALGGCGDWDLWIRVCRRWKVAYVSEPLVYYRRHSDASGMSDDHAYMLADALRVLEKTFADPALPGPARSLEGRAYAELYFVFGKTALSEGRRVEARASFAKAFRAWPRNLRPARYWLKALAGLGG